MIHFKCSDACYYENQLWTVDGRGRFLYGIDLNNWTIKQVQLVSKEIPIQYRRMIKCNNIIYFIKNRGIAVYKYDLKLMQVLFYKMNDEDDNVVMDAFFYGKEIIIVPLYIRGVLYSFHTESCEFCKMECSLNGSEMKKRIHIPSVKLVENKILFITDNGDAIQSFDILTHKINKYLLSNGLQIGGINCQNDLLFLLSITDYHLYQWDPFKGVINEYFYEGKVEKKDIYARIIVYKNKIYLFSVMSNGIYKVNKNNNKIEKIYSVEIDKTSNASALFIEYVIVDNRIIILPWKARKFVEIKCDTDEVFEHEINIGESEILKEYYSIFFEKKCIVYENENFNEKELVSGVRKIKNKKMEELEEKKGSIIYKKLKCYI